MGRGAVRGQRRRGAYRRRAITWHKTMFGEDVCFWPAVFFSRETSSSSFLKSFLKKKPRFFLVILSVQKRLKRSVFRIQHVFPYPNVFGISKASKGPCKKKLTF